MITGDKIEEITKCGVSIEYAFAVLLAAAFGLDVIDNSDDRDLFNNYFCNMLHKHDPDEYYADPYYRDIKIPSVKLGNSELKYDRYKPFEGFVCNDIFRTADGMQIPQIGFFETEFLFPAVFEDDRLWMSITPNEIETMKEAVEKAFGSVLTFGLGLGYYAYMVSLKSEVTEITIVESNDDVINLFNKYILPQFKYSDKIRIVKADAFEYAQNHLSGGKFDFVFTDLWHDVSDGIDMYLQMKKCEALSPDTQFMYWIEKSIRCYL